MLGGGTMWASLVCWLCSSRLLASSAAVASLPSASSTSSIVSRTTTNRQLPDVSGVSTCPNLVFGQSSKLQLDVSLLFPDLGPNRQPRICRKFESCTYRPLIEGYSPMTFCICPSSAPCGVLNAIRMNNADYTVTHFCHHLSNRVVCRCAARIDRQSVVWARRRLSSRICSHMCSATVSVNSNMGFWSVDIR